MRQSAVSVIGAGIGGLSAAIHLAQAGHRVTVFEQNPHVGGKMAVIEQDGFRWDCGPSVVTMRHVFEDLFKSAGRNIADYLTLLSVEPSTRYFYPDGMIFDASHRGDLMRLQIAEFAPDDIDGFGRFLEQAADIHRITGPVFVYDSPPTPASFLRVPVRDWFKVDALRTMQQSIESNISSPKLRQLLGRFATYVGGSPYEAPATLNLIADVELAGGVYYPRGGIYAIAAAMEKLAIELGVDIRCNQQVVGISAENEKAVGLSLGDGSAFRSDAIVSNLDVTTTYQHLLKDHKFAKKRLKRLNRQEPSCSGFVMLLGIDKQHPELAHHNIWFSADYPREFDEIFKQEKPPDFPTVYATITSKSDPEHAPDGQENWFILVNAPALSDQFDWDREAAAYRERVLDQLESHGVMLRSHIKSERWLTPNDLEQMSGAHRGALYGASPNSRWTAFRRPHNRCPDLKGLYFAGGTTHPGGGVPMVTLSGKVAAQLLMEDLA